MSTSTSVGRRRRRAPDRGLSEPEVDSPASDVEPADPSSVARGLLLRKLTNAPATRAQLADLLSSRGIPDDVADEVLGRFEEVGLIDDASYASLWVESRQRGRGLARRALLQELAQRGVAPELIEQSLESVSPDTERATARALVLRKLSATSTLERQARVRRLVGMLARRGYPSGLAFAVVLDALGGEADDDEPLGALGPLDD